MLWYAHDNFQREGQVHLVDWHLLRGPYRPNQKTRSARQEWDPLIRRRLDKHPSEW